MFIVYLKAINKCIDLYKKKNWYQYIYPYKIIEKIC